MLGIHKVCTKLVAAAAEARGKQNHKAMSMAILLVDYKLPHISKH